MFAVPGMYVRQFLDHHELGAAFGAAFDLEFVHEGAHQEQAAAGGAQQVFFGQRVGNLGKLEALRLGR